MFMLYIYAMPPTTVSEVLQQLEQIASHCTKNNSRQAFFAILYLQMTQAVEAGMVKGSFANAQRMEALDVRFAQRYIDAWQAYQQQQPVSKAWQTAFKAAENNSLMVLQHLLLGINAHINLDLGIAAAQTAPGDAIDDLKSDFDAINGLIAELAGGMQKKLEGLSLPLRLLANLANGQEKAVLNFSIGKAREAAWLHACALAPMAATHQQKYLDVLDAAVADLGNKVIRPGWLMNLLVSVVKWWEPKNVGQICALLSS